MFFAEQTENVLLHSRVGVSITSNTVTLAVMLKSRLNELEGAEQPQVKVKILNTERHAGRVL